MNGGLAMSAFLQTSKATCYLSIYRKGLYYCKDLYDAVSVCNWTMLRCQDNNKTIYVQNILLIEILT